MPVSADFSQNAGNVRQDDEFGRLKSGGAAAPPGIRDQPEQHPRREETGHGGSGSNRLHEVEPAASERAQ